MKIFKLFIVPTIISLVIFGVLIWLRAGIDKTNYIKDSLWVTGAFMLGFTGLVFVSNEGTFDLIIYGANKFFDFFRREPKITYKFHDYVLMKSEKDNAKLWPSFAIGLVYFIIGTILSL